MNSNDIKKALMRYFKKERNYLCATEVISTSRSVADVLADTGNRIIEVEVKISKSDLLKEFDEFSDKRKTKWNLKYAKHQSLKEGIHYNTMKEDYEKRLWGYINFGLVNQFYFCVPLELLEFTIDLVKEKNNKYGVMLYNTNDSERTIIVKKKAKIITEKYCATFTRLIANRLCSELVWKYY